MDKPLPISGPSLLCLQSNGERAACLFYPYIPTVGDWVIFTRLRSHTDELCPPRIIPFTTIIRPQDTARPADSYTHSRLSHCPTHHRRSQSAEFLLCGQDTPPHPPILSRFPPVPPHPAPAGDSGGGPPSSRFLWAPHMPSACSCPGHVRPPTCSSPLLSLVDPSENPLKGMMDPSPRKKCLPVQEVHGSPEIHPRLCRSLWTPG